jgi:hypothetical protein
MVRVIVLPRPATTGVATQVLLFVLHVMCRDLCTIVIRILGDTLIVHLVLALHLSIHLATIVTALLLVPISPIVCQVKLLVSVIGVLHTVAPAVLLVVHHDHSGTHIVIHIILVVITICLHSTVMGNLQGMTAIATVVLTNTAVSLLHP